MGVGFYRGSVDGEEVGIPDCQGCANLVPQKGGGEGKGINLCGAVSHDQRCGGERGQASMTAKVANLVSQKGGGGKGKALYCREQWPLGHSSLRGLASSYHHRRGGGV